MQVRRSLLHVLLILEKMAPSHERSGKKRQLCLDPRKVGSAHVPPGTATVKSPGSSRSEQVRATKFTRDWWSSDDSFFQHRQHVASSKEQNGHHADWSARSVTVTETLML